MSKNPTAPATAPVEEEILLPYTHKFAKPFRYGTETHTEVVIDHEPTAGDLADIMNEKKPGDQFIRMVSCATGWPDPMVKALPGREVLEITKVVNHFLPSGLPTGV